MDMWKRLCAFPIGCDAARCSPRKRWKWLAHGDGEICCWYRIPRCFKCRSISRVDIISTHFLLLVPLPVDYMYIIVPYRSVMYSVQVHMFRWFDVSACLFTVAHIYDILWGPHASKEAANIGDGGMALGVAWLGVGNRRKLVQNAEVFECFAHFFGHFVASLWYLYPVVKGKPACHAPQFQPQRWTKGPKTDSERCFWNESSLRSSFGDSKCSVG